MASHNNKIKVLKLQLIILSLAPLFFLTVIKNYEWSELFCHSICSLIVFGICLIWIIASFIIFIKFRLYRTFNCVEGQTIEKVTPENDAGLNFWLTYILPILLDDLKDWQNAVTFALIVFLMIILLYKTNLYYANPVLVILGYKIIHFEFTSPPKEEYRGEMIGICPAKVDSRYVVKFKHVSDNVFCVKNGRTSENA